MMAEAQGSPNLAQQLVDLWVVAEQECPFGGPLRVEWYAPRARELIDAYIKGDE